MNCPSCGRPLGRKGEKPAKKGPRGKLIHRSLTCQHVELRKFLEKEGKIPTLTTGDSDENDGGSPDTGESSLHPG